jgi:hypothetical protein
MPWWNRLTAIEMVLPYSAADLLALLRDHVPEGLQEIRLSDSSMVDLPGLEQLLEQVGRAPLRSLHLHNTPLRADIVSRLLDGSTRCELEELALSRCRVSPEHARVLGTAPGVENLLSLNLSGNTEFNVEAARALFSSQRLRSLVHLNLNFAQLGSEGAIALANAPGWDRLRSLDVSATKLSETGLRALLASPNLRRLNWLKVSGGGYPDPTLLTIPQDIARSITELPHLAHLELWVEPLGSESRSILSSCDALAWHSIDDPLEEGYSLPWGSRWTAAQTPPLDTVLEGDWRGR